MGALEAITTDAMRVIEAMRGGGDEGPVTQATSGRERLVALLRLMAFLGIAVGLTAGVLVLVRVVLKLHIDMDSTSQTVVLLGELVLVLATVVIPTGLLVAFTREPAARFGWGVRPRAWQLVLGLLAGLCLMTALLGLIALVGGAAFSSSPLPAASIARYGLGYAAIFSLTAVSEEGFLRGYGLVQLSRAISFWPAALLSSLVFGALHLVHQGETPLGLVQVALFGLLMAFSFLRSGGLWFAVGFHAAWDFTETFLFGVPDSGVASAGSLLTTRFHGSTWLTGGSAGPEGSVVVLPILALLGLIIAMAFFRPASGAGSNQARMKSRPART